MPQCTPILIDHAPAMHTAVVRATQLPVSELGPFMDAAYRALGEAITSGRIHPIGAAVSRYDSEFGATVDLEAGFPIAEPLTEAVVINDIEIVPSELPAGETATTTLTGGYDQLAPAWEQLMAGVNEAGRTPAMPFWEIYQTKPMPGIDPDTMQTQLVILLQPQGE